MTDILVTSPFQPFTLPTQFKAVFNGYIYCGTVDAVDPSVSQVQVYLVNESGDKVPVAQPLRTNAGGFLVYNGQPAKFVTDSNHSLLVKDSLQAQIWYEPDMAKIDPNDAINFIFDELASSDGAGMIGVAGGGTVQQYLSEGYSVFNVDHPPYNGDLISAINAIPENSVLLLGKKTYSVVNLWTGTRNTKKNIILVGQGMPELSVDKSRFVDGSGTIIQGAVKNQAKGFGVFNLGIDCGNYVSQNVYSPATYEDAFVNYGVGANANIQYGNLKTLNSIGIASKPATHSVLMEQLSGVVHGYVECIGGFHGYTVKCKNLQGGKVKVYAQYGDGFIFKSDAGGPCSDIHVDSITVGLHDNTGWPDVSMGGIYDAHDNITVDNIHIGELAVYNAAWGLIPASGATGFTTNCSIGLYIANQVFGNYYSMDINAKCVGWSIGEHLISNTSGGIRVDNNSDYINIGTGYSKNSTESGYALGGNNLMHGPLVANENGKYGVDYLGGIGLDVSQVRGFVNGNGLISGAPSAKDGAPVNGWGDTGQFDMLVIGKMVNITGFMTRGTAAVAHNALTICQPRKRTPLIAWGINPSGGMIPIQCYIETNGNLNVVGFASVASGAEVNISGQYLCK